MDALAKVPVSPSLPAPDAGQSKSLSPAMIRIFWNIMTALIARELGADPQNVLAQDMTTQRPKNPAWLLAARIRRLAMYVAVVELEVSASTLARALGCTKQNVGQAIASVEDLRDDGVIDKLLDECASLVARGRA
jgi:hypothetical protein